jgi:GntR family transcriptional regulator
LSTQITVDLKSAVPPFEQVRSQLASLITSGVLEPGARLPSVRDLATDLGLAVGTVARAYRELEALGLVVSRRRTGTVVADNVAIEPGVLQGAIERLVSEADAAGVGNEQVLALVQGALLRRKEN